MRENRQCPRRPITGKAAQNVTGTPAHGAKKHRAVGLSDPLR